MIAMNSAFSRCSRFFFKVSICVSPMVKPSVMAQSYHRLLERAAVLFFLLLISYAVTGQLTEHEQAREEEVYGKTDFKRSMHFLSWRVEQVGYDQTSGDVRAKGKH
jgi:hypothetical protein